MYCIILANPHIAIFIIANDILKGYVMPAALDGLRKQKGKLIVMVATEEVQHKFHNRVSMLEVVNNGN